MGWLRRAIARHRERELWIEAWRVLAKCNGHEYVDTPRDRYFSRRRRATLSTVRMERCQIPEWIAEGHRREMAAEQRVRTARFWRSVLLWWRP